MPNGGPNWVRLCYTIAGFYETHGKWPFRVILPAIYLEDIRNHILTPEAFWKVEQKVQLVAGKAEFRAEDDSGLTYDYGTSWISPARAESWLGVNADRDIY